MIIPDYRVGTTFITQCATRYKNDRGEPLYDSFDINPNYAYMWGRKPDEIRTVRGTIVEEDVLVNELMSADSNYDCEQTDYFGWIEFLDDGTYDLRMVYPNVKLYFMCFPYTPDVKRFRTEDNIDVDGNVRWRKGDRVGMSVRLKIEEIQIDNETKIEDYEKD